jgi:hypothetical protein
MGSTNNSTKTKGGGKCATDPGHKSLCNQRVGLATSSSPYVVLGCLDLHHALIHSYTHTLFAGTDRGRVALRPSSTAARLASGMIR